MKALIQRVKYARCVIGGVTVSEIAEGLLVLLGVDQADTEREAEILAAKTAKLRIFEDENGKMNLSLLDVSGSALVISNFTLCADTSHGNRPDFFGAARPETAKPLYEAFVRHLHASVSNVGVGVFGADMQIELLNDGPVTLMLDTAAFSKGKRE